MLEGLALCNSACITVIWCVLLSIWFPNLVTEILQADSSEDFSSKFEKARKKCDDRKRRREKDSSRADVHFATNYSEESNCKVDNSQTPVENSSTNVDPSKNNKTTEQPRPSKIKQRLSKLKIFGSSGDNRNSCCAHKDIPPKKSSEMRPCGCPLNFK